MPKDVLKKRVQVSIAVPGEAEEGETAGYVAVERGRERAMDTSSQRKGELQGKAGWVQQ